MIVALILLVLGIMALYFGRGVTAWLVVGVVLVVLAVIVALSTYNGDSGVDSEVAGPKTLQSL